MVKQNAETRSRPPKGNATSWGAKMGFSMISTLMTPMAALATAPILARGLGVEGRGELAAAHAPLLMATAVGLLGLQEALTYYVARYSKMVRRSVIDTTVLVAGLGVVASLVTWFIAHPLSAGNEEVSNLIKVSAVAILPSFLIAVPRAFVAGTQNWRLQAVEAGMHALLRLGGIVGLWLTGSLTALSALLVLLLAPVISACLYLPYMVGAIKNEMLQEKRHVSYRSLLNFGSRVWIGSFSGIVLTRVDQLLMIPLSSESQLGLYAVAVTIGEAPVLLSAAMRSVIFSADAAEGETGSNSTLDQRLQQTARLATLLTFIAAMGVISTAWWWLPLLFGEEFSEAIPLVAVLLLAAVLGSAGSVAGAGLSARQRPGMRSLGMTIGAILNVTVLLLLAPRIGAMGAAISTVIGSFVAGSLNILWLCLLFNHRPWAYYGLRRSDVSVLCGGVKRLFNK